MTGRFGIKVLADGRTASFREELETLLGETPETAQGRVAAHRLPESAPLVLYGAGIRGQDTLARLRKAGISAVAFADDTPGKQGSTIAGIPVLAPQAAAKRFGVAAIFVVTIHNPSASYAAIRRRLRQQTASRVISFLELAWAYPCIFLPYLAFELPGDLLTKASFVRRTFDLLNDAESQRQFVAHLRFRLRLDFDGLPASRKGDYFDAGVLGALAADVTYVDCGAYDGDTIRLFLARCNDRFGKILAFEPDGANYRRLSDYIGTLPEPLRRRIVIRQAAVWDRRGRHAFDATGTTGAAFGGAGEIDTVALDDEIADDNAPLLIKIDVEGAEAQALAGARRAIQYRRPVVALSIYHRPDDLWELPAALHALDPSSQLFIRTLGEDGMDIVCYAVPRAVAR